MLRILKTAMAALLIIGGLAAPSLAATVKVLVNNAEITDTEIAARAALLRVERRGSSNSQRLKMATDELIDEQLKLQEADRLGITVTNSQVDDAFLSIARNLELSADKLTNLLQQSGVNPNTLRSRLKAGVAWQAVSRAAIAPRVQVSDLDLEKKAEAQLDTKSSFDYILKEVRFIIPKGSGVSTSRRTADANQYRRSFQGCDSAVDLSLSFTDAAVIDLGRRHATQLPDAIANELAGLSTGRHHQAARGRRRRVDAGRVLEVGSPRHDFHQEQYRARSRLRKAQGAGR